MKIRERIVSILAKKASWHKNTARLWLGSPYDDGPCIRLYAARSGCVFASLNVGGDDQDLSLVVGTGLVMLSASLEGLIPRKIRSAAYAYSKRLEEELETQHGQRHFWSYQLDPLGGREFRVAVHDGTIWLSFWANDDAWCNLDRKDWPWRTNGWAANFNLVKALLGATDYQTKDHEKQAGTVIMPEKRYPATIKISRVRWPRPRSLLGRRWQWRGAVHIDGGIPIPGKGTTSYNCGEDATYSISFGAQRERPHPHALCQRLAIDVLKRRQRYGGGTDWMPADVLETNATHLAHVSKFDIGDGASIGSHIDDLTPPQPQDTDQ